LDSAILKVAQASFEKISGEKANIRAIHAGLECGLFLEKYPYLDMISIGPTMKDIHSPDERLSISDTKKCFEWLCQILEYRV
jgi:dipeptidase D